VLKYRLMALQRGYVLGTLCIAQPTLLSLKKMPGKGVGLSGYNAVVITSSSACASPDPGDGISP
jgi:hypothetical protein